MNPGSMIEVEVEVEAWTDAIDDVEAVVERAAVAALGMASGGVVILLTDDETVRDLNDRFRGKDRPTKGPCHSARQNHADEHSTEGRKTKLSG